MTYTPERLAGMKDATHRAAERMSQPSSIAKSCDYCGSAGPTRKTWDSGTDEYVYLCAACREDVAYCERKGKETARP